MTVDVRRPLVVFRLVAAITALAVIAVHLIGPTPWAFALDAVAVGHWLSHIWLVRTLKARSLRATVILLCAVQFVAAILFTIVEPWMLHLTPLMCLGPVVVVSRIVDTTFYKRLTFAAIVVIIAMTATSRLFDGEGAIHAASARNTRSVGIVLLPPSLAGFVGWVAWRNQRTMLGQLSAIVDSKARIELVDESARLHFEHASAALRLQLEAVHQNAVEAIEDDQADIGHVNGQLQEVAGQLRTIAHGLGNGEFSFDELSDVDALVRLLGIAVDVENGGLGLRSETIDELARSAIIELRDASEGALEKVLVHRYGTDVVAEVVLTVGADSRDVLKGLSTETLDRIEALGGWCSAEPRLVKVVLRAWPDAPVVGSRTTDLTADLRLGAVFPVMALVVASVLGLTALRDVEMFVVIALIGVLYTFPCLAASSLASRYPNLSLVVFVASNWVTAVVITDRLDIVKWFGAIALLIPLLLALPHLGGKQFGVLAVGTFLVTAIVMALSRIGTQIEVARQAPDLVTDLTIVVLIALTSALVLTVTRRNHDVLSEAATALRESRRRIVEESDRAKRTLERDLHDGTQQRLVSGAIRLQIAERSSGSARLRNLELAVAELVSAEQSWADLIVGTAPAELTAAGLGVALEGLAHSSPVPVHVHAETLPIDIDRDVESSVWFCCSEAIANAVKHAGDRAEIVVTIYHTGTGIEFSIVDSGRGFTGEGRPGGGLSNIRERCASHGGTVAIESKPNRGTAVRGSVPNEPVRPELLREFR